MAELIAEAIFEQPIFEQLYIALKLQDWNVETLQHLLPLSLPKRLVREIGESEKRSDNNGGSTLLLYTCSCTLANVKFLVEECEADIEHAGTATDELRSCVETNATPL